MSLRDPAVPAGPPLHEWLLTFNFIKGEQPSQFGLCRLMAVFADLEDLCVLDLLALLFAVPFDDRVAVLVGDLLMTPGPQIGRASCRERV